MALRLPDVSHKKKFRIIASFYSNSTHILTVTLTWLRILRVWVCGPNADGSKSSLNNSVRSLQSTLPGNVRLLTSSKQKSLLHLFPMNSKKRKGKVKLHHSTLLLIICLQQHDPYCFIPTSVLHLWIKSFNCCLLEDDLRCMIARTIGSAQRQTSCDHGMMKKKKISQRWTKV